MPSLDEAQSSQIAGALGQAIGWLGQFQEVRFQAYTRVVLPIDQFVYWSPTVSFCVEGSIHFAQDIQQNTDETVGFATVTFSTQSKVTRFTDVPVNTIFVGTIAGFRFAFSRQNGFYDEAKVWHYTGSMVYPALATQLLDDPESIDPDQAVVSNSLPLWIALNSYAPIYYDWFQKTGTQLYPADMLPANLLPPYGVVDIQTTTADQATPYLDMNRNHWQLCTDEVTVTLYGFQNNAAMDFMDCVNQYSVNSSNFGIRNVPVISDVRRKQSELMTIAMKKQCRFSVSYNQHRAAEVARQLILKARATLIVGLASQV